MLMKGGEWETLALRPGGHRVWWPEAALNGIQAEFEMSRFWQVDRTSDFD